MIVQFISCLTRHYSYLGPVLLPRVIVDCFPQNMIILNNNRRGKSRAYQLGPNVLVQKSIILTVIIVEIPS